MAAAGLALGLALSTRWTSLWAWGFLGLVFLALRSRRRREAPPDIDAPSQGPRWREAALLAIAFLVLPAAVYLLSYVPWMRQGHTVMDVVRLQSDDLELPREPRARATPTSAAW